MDEMKIIQYLLDEVEEGNYIRECYNEEYKLAEKKAKAEGLKYYQWNCYKPDYYPSKASLEQNLLKIRKLTFKVEKRLK